jgi:signal transduction histidine kinase
MATTKENPTEDQPTPIYKNRKTFVGYLVRPKQQARAAMFFAAATWVVHLILMYLIVPNLSQLDQTSVSVYILISAAVLSVFAIITGIVVTHRLFGPLVAIKRHVAHLREGQYSSRLNLRSTDDLGELKDSLNDLASALESRHGSGKRSQS